MISSSHATSFLSLRKADFNCLSDKVGVINVVSRIVKGKHRTEKSIQQLPAQALENRLSSGRTLHWTGIENSSVVIF
jgi:hypothetical protein